MGLISVCTQLQNLHIGEKYLNETESQHFGQIGFTLDLVSRQKLCFPIHSDDGSLILAAAVRARGGSAKKRSRLNFWRNTAQRHDPVNNHISWRINDQTVTEVTVGYNVVCRVYSLNLVCASV